MKIEYVVAYTHIGYIEFIRLGRFEHKADAVDNISYLLKHPKDSVHKDVDYVIFEVYTS